MTTLRIEDIQYRKLRGIYGLASNDEAINTSIMKTTYECAVLDLDWTVGPCTWHEICLSCDIDDLIDYTDTFPVCTWKTDPCLDSPLVVFMKGYLFLVSFPSRIDVADWLVGQGLRLKRSELRDLRGLLNKQGLDETKCVYAELWLDTHENLLDQEQQNRNSVRVKAAMGAGMVGNWIIPDLWMVVAEFI